MVLGLRCNPVLGLKWKDKPWESAVLPEAEHTFTHQGCSTHTHIHTLPSLLSLFFFFVSPSHSLEWQLLNCDKRAVSDQPPYLGDWLNDLSITQPLLYSPSTDRVTRQPRSPFAETCVTIATVCHYILLSMHSDANVFVFYI